MAIQYGLVADDQTQAFLPLVPDSTVRNLLDDQEILVAGAVKDGKAAGIMIFRKDEFSVDIQYLAVAQDCRRQGIATGMINFLCKIAWNTGKALLCSFMAENRDDPICRLLTKRGDFTMNETGDYICRFPCGELKDVRLGAQDAECNIEFFYKLPEHVQNSFIAHMKEDNYEFVRGLNEDKDTMLESLCLCVEEKGVVNAALFCRSQDGDVVLSFLYSKPGYVRSLMALICRLREMLVKVSHKLNYLRIAAVTPESRKLVETILPRREIVGKFYLACWDMNTMGD